MINTDTPSSCDVVVIGAGMGGLTSAAILAKAGMRVCVVEAQSRPGGFLAGFDRKDFRFDTAIHWLNQCGPEGFVRRIFDHIGPGSPQTQPMRRIRRYKGDSFDYLLTDDPDQLRDQLIDEFPSDERGVRSFFLASRTLGLAFQGMSDIMRARETMSSLERARFGLAQAKIGMPFVRYLGWSAPKGMRKFFKNDGIRRIFCSEERFLSCAVPIGWAYTGDYQLPPVGGSQAFPAWLCSMLDSRGATVAYRNRATSIDVVRGRVRGVTVTSGRRRTTEHHIRCDHIVAACDLATVYEKMLPAGTIPDKIIRKLRDAEVYDSSVTLSIGLDTPTENLGFGEEMITLTRDDVTRAEHNCGDPHKTAIAVLAPSLRDPTLAPGDKGTLTIYAPATLDYGGQWKTGPDLERGAAYKAFKKAYADVLIDRVESAVAPGLRPHVEFCDVATPVTHLRYTDNRAGSIMATRPTGANMRAGVSHYLTPVDNLVLGGHWAEYGGGVPLAVKAGANSAAIILRREKSAAFTELSDVMDGVT